MTTASTVASLGIGPTSVPTRRMAGTVVAVDSVVEADAETTATTVGRVAILPVIVTASLLLSATSVESLATLLVTVPTVTLVMAATTSPATTVARLATSLVTALLEVPAVAAVECPTRSATRADKLGTSPAVVPNASRHVTPVAVRATLPGTAPKGVTAVVAVADAPPA